MKPGGGEKSANNRRTKLCRWDTSNHKYYIGKRINNLKIYNKLKNAWKKKYPILYKNYSNRLLCYHLDTEIVDTNF